MHTIQPKTWHWSLGGNRGVVDLDLQKAIMHGCVCINGVTEEWVETYQGEGKLRKKKYQQFKETARPGDKIFIFCKGKIRASGTFTGNIFPITSGEALWFGESAERYLRRQINTHPEAGTGSFKAMIRDLKVFEEPKDGAGVVGTLYEVKQEMKNFHNYQ